MNASNKRQKSVAGSSLVLGGISATAEVKILSSSAKGPGLGRLSGIGLAKDGDDDDDGAADMTVDITYISDDSAADELFTLDDSDDDNVGNSGSDQDESMVSVKKRSKKRGGVADKDKPPLAAAANKKSRPHTVDMESLALLEQPMQPLDQYRVIDLKSFLAARGLTVSGNLQSFLLFFIVRMFAC